MTEQQHQISSSRAISGALVVGLVLGGIGGCVLAQVKGPTDMKGVSVDELGIVSEESLESQLGIEGFILRMRAVTIEPGGHIREHHHKTSPALVQMFSGTWIEGLPDGSEVTHQPGSLETIIEDRDTVHWVYNRGDTPAVGVVCGIQPSKK